MEGSREPGEECIIAELSPYAPQSINPGLRHRDFMRHYTGYRQLDLVNRATGFKRLCSSLINFGHLKNI